MKEIYIKKEIKTMFTRNELMTKKEAMLEVGDKLGKLNHKAHTEGNADAAELAKVYNRLLRTMSKN